ncbi:Trp biosynthesis-associated membrane protein [Actinocatenispora sera]|uniref:Membrane protein (TIGR02234 family) n=1 Tax=Actinocatenispora sera TaxID=390989 RepID=A0A810L6X2_9ACTN|nr:Trp biosynthesis-associated membrane protein [Actinocatenispora sera]BCJ30879.1 hypothetical protein Asera_49870 [Actinocatenispora sera]
MPDRRPDVHPDDAHPETAETSQNPGAAQTAKAAEGDETAKAAEGDAGAETAKSAGDAEGVGAPVTPGTDVPDDPDGVPEVAGPVLGRERPAPDGGPGRRAATPGGPARPAARRPSTRGQLVLAVVACTLGAGIALYAASKNWSVQAGRPLGPLHLQQTGRTGTEITPVVPTLALISLAGAGALVATRRIGRLLVGVLLILTGFGVAAGAGYGLSAAAHDPGTVTPGWAITALVGGLLVAAVGFGTVLRGRGWPTMGSRYERTAGRTARVGADDDAAKIWDAIDDGHDPTVR